MHFIVYVPIAIWNEFAIKRKITFSSVLLRESALIAACLSLDTRVSISDLNAANSALSVEFSPSKREAIADVVLAWGALNSNRVLQTLASCHNASHHIKRYVSVLKKVWGLKCRVPVYCRLMKLTLRFWESSDGALQLLQYRVNKSSDSELLLSPRWVSLTSNRGSAILPVCHACGLYSHVLPQYSSIMLAAQMSSLRRGIMDASLASE